MENKSVEAIGKLNNGIIEHFNLTGLTANQDIFCGQTNRTHMQNEHPEDYAMYSHLLEDILENPTYIAKHPKKNSIEYIKELSIDKKKVLVAVRATTKGVLFARTLFVMSDEKVAKYTDNGALIPYSSIKH